MRIVHFSDIHLGTWPRGFSYLFDKRLLGAFNYVLRRRRKVQESRIGAAFDLTRQLRPDLVVCTGDLTAIGTPAEFERVKAWMIPFATDNRWPFIYIPGNHDLYVQNPACREHFLALYRFLNREQFPFERLPVEYEHGGVSFLLVNECMPNGPLSSAGRLTPESATRLQDWLCSDRADVGPRILLGHFPSADAAGRPLPPRRRLFGGEIIRQALTDGTLDVSLCGHIHHAFARREPGGGVEICAGSLTMEGRLSVLDIDGTRAVQHQFMTLDG